MYVDLHLYLYKPNADPSLVSTGKADYDAIDPNFYNYITFQAMPTLLFEHSTAKGGNMLGMEGLGKNAILFQMQQMVRTAEEEKIARERLIIMHDALKTYNREHGIDVEWEYLGYADEFQNPLGSYGAGNVQYMRDVAARYDPDQVFQTRVPGGFKISKVVWIMLHAGIFQMHQNPYMHHCLMFARNLYAFRLDLPLMQGEILTCIKKILFTAFETCRQVFSPRPCDTCQRVHK